MATSQRLVSQYQRRILGLGGLLVVVLYLVGAPWYLDRIERDLTDRTAEALADAGFDGLAVSFAGQTASIDCDAPLPRPSEMLDVVFAVRGVRSVADLPSDCRVLTPAPDGTDDDPASSTVPSATSVPGPDPTVDPDGADFATVLAVLDGSPQFSLLRQIVREAGIDDELRSAEAVTFFAPTDAAFDALPPDAVAGLRSDDQLLRRVLGHLLVSSRLVSGDLVPGPLADSDGGELVIGSDGGTLTVDGIAIGEADLLAVNGAVHAVDQLPLPAGVELVPEASVPVEATFADGRFVLTGAVVRAADRSLLVEAAEAVVGPDRVVDELGVDPGLGIPTDRVAVLAGVVPAVGEHLVSGVAGVDGSGLTVTGVVDGSAAREAFEAAVAGFDAVVELTDRPQATADDAAELEASLNLAITRSPLLFEMGSAVIDPASIPVLDELADAIRREAGVLVTIEGHTDSDGVPSENLALSAARAAAVRTALVERGVDPVALVSVGYGSERPVLVDGEEDKAASRRVEFVVELR